MRISDWSSDVCSSDLTGEREIRNEAGAVMRERRDQVLLGIAVQQAVFALSADERFVAVLPRGSQRNYDAPGFKIRSRHVANFAVAHPHVDRTPHFVHWRALLPHDDPGEERGVVGVRDVSW